jgi:hypothetical protein
LAVNGLLFGHKRVVARPQGHSDRNGYDGNNPDGKKTTRAAFQPVTSE